MAINRKPVDKYVGLDKHLASFCYYEDKLAVARKHGFDSWYEFLQEAWAQYESCNQIAKIADMSPTAILKIIKRLGFKSRGVGKIWPTRFNYKSTRRT